MDRSSYQKVDFSQTTQYSGVPSYLEEHSPDPSADVWKHEPLVQQHEVDLQSHPQLHGCRSWLTTIIVQGFSLLWICPIVVLLWLNLSGHILGSSAWCPGGRCYPQMFNSLPSVPEMLLAEHDHENHNLLGALQLVAKALEIWFILICSWLVYLITMFLAGRKAGLPIAYINRPSDFSEMPSLLDPLLWRTLPKPFGPRKSRKRIWSFVLFTCALGLLCNLMGPATAVLVIPALQWITTEKVQPFTFVSYDGAQAPGPYSYAQYSTQDCTADQFRAMNYSCTANPWATAMDSWVQSYMSSQGQMNGIAQQDMVSFGFNYTMIVKDDTITDLTFWAPSRTMMRYLSIDYDILSNMSLGLGIDEMDPNFANQFDSYIPLNNTVQLAVQREGPVFGVQANMWLGYDNKTWFDTTIDEDRYVRCYKNYNVFNSPILSVLEGTYTKCVKWGTGWDYNYREAGFTIEGEWKSWISPDTFGPDLRFDIWTSDTVAFLPEGKLPTGMNPLCLFESGRVPSNVTCDWTSFFSVDESSPLAARSRWSNTIQITANMKPVQGHPTTIDLMFDFTALLNFTTYSLDPSPQSNPLSQVTMPHLPVTGKPVEVAPAWTTAAWSADLNGTIRANRSSTLAMLSVVDRLWDLDVYDPTNTTNALLMMFPNVDYIALLPIIQTLSLLEYTMDNTTATPVDAEHPQFHRNARINVWAYGMSGRTSYLGVIVAIAGIVVVLCQGVLGVIDRRPYRSPTELLTAALEHAPSEEFKDRCHNELAMARTPFRVEEGDHGFVSKFKFHKAG